MIKEGQKAPAFTGKDQYGNKISLKDYLGKKLVIFFYPKDFTPTCTTQVCNLRDNYSLIRKKGIEVIGINSDTIMVHEKFSSKYQLPFPLLADETRSIIEKYGVWGDKQMFGVKYKGIFRTTFLVDEKGIVRKVISKPASKKHTEEIITSWEAIENESR
jgi:thioredoxin-dependent peroxiredoxin